MKRIPAFASIAVLVAALPAMAGTEAEPDILDKTGVDDVDAVLFPWYSVPVPEVDIEKVWVVAEPEVVTVHVKLVDLKHETVPGQGLAYSFGYSNDEYPYVVASLEWDNFTAIHAWRAWVDATDSGGQRTVQSIAFQVDREGSILRLDIPRAFARSTLHDAHAATFHMVTVGDRATTPLPNWPRDYAPNGWERGPDIPVDG